LGRKKG